MSLPTVSVVVPLRDEERWIGPCLEAVQAQDYPAHLLEILVVDGRSRDRSREVVARCQARDPRVRLLDNPRTSIPAALNVGIRAARGDVIARVDARTRLAPDYLATGIELLRARGASGVGGPVRYAAGAFLARVAALVTQSPFGLGGAAARYGDGREHWADTVYLGIYPRTVFEAVGLYDEEIVQDEDTELNCRLRAGGGRLLMSPRLRSAYDNLPSLRRFVRKNFGFGYWKVRVWQRHRRLICWRHFAAPVFVLGLVVGPPLALVAEGAGGLLASGLTAYLAGGLLATVGLCRRAGWRYAPALMAAFPLLHLSWGTGFLVGALRFLPAWFAPAMAPPRLPGRAEGSAAA